MIFETLAHMADREDDGEDNYSSTEAQAKAVLEALAASGNLTLPNEIIVVGGVRYIVSNKSEEYKHVLTGIQRKIPNGILQDHQASSSSYSMSSSSSDGTYYPSLQCSGGTQPSMVVSVTGASGTIDWLGKTWNLPADSGLPQEVCPTQYYNEQWSGSTYFQGGNGWNLTASLGQAALRIKRVYGNFPSVVYQLNQINVRDINNGGINTYDRNFFATYPGPVTTHYTQNAFGLVNSVPPALPTFSEYQITDEFFGSYTIGGITYSWSKGTNWPA